MQDREGEIGEQDRDEEEEGSRGGGETDLCMQKPPLGCFMSKRYRYILPRLITARLWAVPISQSVNTDAKLGALSI
jgi:hypothetical protein